MFGGLADLSNEPKVFDELGLKLKNLIFLQIGPLILALTFFSQALQVSDVVLTQQ